MNVYVGLSQVAGDVNDTDENQGFSLMSRARPDNPRCPSIAAKGGMSMMPDMFENKSISVRGKRFMQGYQTMTNRGNKFASARFMMNPSVLSLKNYGHLTEPIPIGDYILKNGRQEYTIQDDEPEISDYAEYENGYLPPEKFYGFSEDIDEDDFSDITLQYGGYEEFFNY